MLALGSGAVLLSVHSDACGPPAAVPHLKFCHVRRLEA